MGRRCAQSASSGSHSCVGRHQLRRRGIHPKVPAVPKHQLARLAESVQAVHHRLVTEHLAGLVARAEGREPELRTVEPSGAARPAPVVERPESPVAARLRAFGTPVAHDPRVVIR